MRKLFIYIITLVAIGIIIVLSVAYWQNTQKNALPSPEASANDYQAATDSLKNGKPGDALSLVLKHLSEIEQGGDGSNKWLQVFIDASRASGDASQLIIFYQYRPEVFAQNEKAALLIGALLQSGSKMEEFAALRNKWKGKESDKNAWTLLDADYLANTNKNKEAINLLSTQQFTGPEETARLTRLAFLSINDNPDEAWNYLDKALQNDPGNSDLYLYRARFLEANGKPELAIAQYAAALAAAPDNLLLKEQFADFLLRYRQYGNALDVLAAILQAKPGEMIWLKTFFWNKVVQPVNIDWNRLIPQRSPISPLLGYLSSLPQKTFWDAEAYKAIPDGQRFLSVSQAVHWLRTLQALKDGKESEALALLNNNPFKEPSWNPGLEAALKRIISFRQQQSFDLVDGPAENPELFFQQIANAAGSARDTGNISIDPSLRSLLSSPYAYGAALLAAGWAEAALDMQPLSSIPKDLPDWVAYGFTEALRRVKGNGPALEFATLQTPSPKLDLLIAQLMIAESNQPAAIEILKKYTDNTEISDQAVWLMGMAYLDQKKTSEAKQVVASHPLANTPRGKEILAKAALLEGNPTEAITLYESIINESPEAKSFLARKAMQEKNWERARSLTIELLQLYPNDPLIQNNLKLIDEGRQQDNKL